MNKNLQGVLIAISITIWVLALLHYSYIEGPKHQRQKGAAETQIHSAPDDVRLVCPPFQKGQTISPDMCERDDHYQRRHEKQIADHNAQLSMRNAAWAAFATTLIGLFLIWRTLIYTRNASNLTKDALQTTKDTSYKELRAYLGVRVDAVPVVAGMEHLAVKTVIHNHGQTPAYNIRLVYSLYNGMAQWGPTDNQTTAILNPNEDFSPILESNLKNAKVVRKQDMLFLNLDIIFTDMNGKERWLKINFSKPGKDWPVEKVQLKSPSISRSGNFEANSVIEGGTELYLVKMETGDLEPNKPYQV